MKRYDKIIIGAGFYGLYSALTCAEFGQSILVLECDKESFQRASYINQARIHQGYHYPRSISTAIKSAGYFERFNKDYAFCINKEFDQIYAISNRYSWTNTVQFKEFCKAADIFCEEVYPNRYFKENVCEGAFLTREYTYDVRILKEYLIERISGYKNIEVQYGITIFKIEKFQDAYEVYMSGGQRYQTGFLLNTTYAGTNQILEMKNFVLSMNCVKSYCVT